MDLDIPEGYNSVSSYKARVVIKIEPKVERKTISGIGIKTVNLVDRYNASLEKYHARYLESLNSIKTEERE